MNGFTFYSVHCIFYSVQIACSLTAKQIGEFCFNHVFLRTIKYKIQCLHSVSVLLAFRFRFACIPFPFCLHSIYIRCKDMKNNKCANGKGWKSFVK